MAIHHDENTIRKVYNSLMRAGLLPKEALMAMHELQNSGILFRETKPESFQATHQEQLNQIEELERLET